MAKQLERLQEGNDTRFETMEERTVETKQSVQTLDNKVRQNQDEIMKEVGEVRKDVSKRIQRTYDIANRLDEQIRTNKNNIQEIDQREKNLQERLEALRDTPILSTHTCHSENREVINFQNYRRNPMEFLERMEEFIERNRETR